MEFDAAQLLAPISEEQPTGVNVREDEEAAQHYYRLKDARSAARVAERKADVEADRGPVAPEWRVIFELAHEMLLTRTKDIEVAAWLTEAALRLYGYPGLRQSFLLLDGLVSRYWDQLHSVDTEDLSAKVAPLAGLNGVGADGTLIQPMRLAPITSPRASPPGGLWDYMVKRKKGADSPAALALGAAARETDTAAYKALYAAITGSLNSFTALAARLDTLCGADSPPSSTIRTTLIEAADALRDVSGLAADMLGQVAVEPAAEAAGLDGVVAEPAPAGATVVAPAPAAVYTREDALRELSRIATFFREHEPNSPVGFSLDTLIRRARMPLGELMKELVPDAAVRRAYLSAVGIWPQELGET